MVEIHVVSLKTAKDQRVNIFYVSFLLVRIKFRCKKIHNTSRIVELS